MSIFQGLSLRNVDMYATHPSEGALADGLQELEIARHGTVIIVSFHSEEEVGERNSQANKDYFSLCNFS